MEPELKIIDHKVVLTKKERYTLWRKQNGWRLIFISGFFFCAAIFLKHGSFFFLALGLVLFSLIVAFLDWSYAWVLTEKQLQVTKYNWFKSKLTVYPISEIRKVSWGGSRGYCFKFLLKTNQSFVIFPKETIFKTATLLRGLYHLGVPVFSKQRDAEIEKYIEGKIDKIPIELKPEKKD